MAVSIQKIRPKVYGIALFCSLLSLSLSSFLYTDKINAQPFNQQNLDTFASEVGGAVNQFRANAVPGSSLFNLLAALDTLSGDPLVNALQSLAPIPNGAEYYGAITPLTQSINQIDRRLDLLREDTIQYLPYVPVYYSNGLKSHYSAGDCSDDEDEGDFYIGPLFMLSSEHQSAVSFVPGYQGNLKGFGLIADYDVTTAEWLEGGFDSDSIIFGAGAMYFKNDINNIAGFDNKNQVKSGQLLLYQSVEKNQWFWNTILSGAYSWYNSNRIVNFATIHQEANANYNAYQLGGKFKIGYALVDPLLTPGIKVLPQLSVLALYFKRSHYTERGNVTLVNSVDSNGTTALQGGLGVEILFGQLGDCILPELHAFYNLDFRRTNFDVSNMWVNAGAPFNLSGTSQARTGGNAGFSITTFRKALRLTLGYDLYAAKNYVANSGSLWLKWMF